MRLSFRYIREKRRVEVKVIRSLRKFPSVFGTFKNPLLILSSLSCIWKRYRDFVDFWDVKISKSKRTDN